MGATLCAARAVLATSAEGLEPVWLDTICAAAAHGDTIYRFILQTLTGHILD